jgi:hypothetical protein
MAEVEKVAGRKTRKRRGTDPRCDALAFLSARLLEGTASVAGFALGYIYRAWHSHGVREED